MSAIVRLAGRSRALRKRGELKAHFTNRIAFSSWPGARMARTLARDHGVNVWGAAGPGGALQYVFGVFSGLESSAGVGPNQDNNLLYAGRVAYNFLSVEKNPYRSARKNCRVSIPSRWSVIAPPGTTS